jgi:hypothetical protein
MRFEEEREGRVSEVPEVGELRLRINNHLLHGSSSVEVRHLWSGYLAALVEWGLIDRQRYVLLSRLIGSISTDDLYHLFADEPMPVRDEAS